MDFAAQSKKGRRNRKITAPLIFVPLSPSPSTCAFLFAGSLPLSTLAIAVPFASQPLFLARLAGIGKMLWDRRQNLACPAYVSLNHRLLLQLSWRGRLFRTRFALRVLPSH